MGLQLRHSSQNRLRAWKGPALNAYLLAPCTWLEPRLQKMTPVTIGEVKDRLDMGAPELAGRNFATGTDFIVWSFGEQACVNGILDTGRVK